MRVSNIEALVRFLEDTASAALRYFGSIDEESLVFHKILALVVAQYKNVVQLFRALV